MENSEYSIRVKNVKKQFKVYYDKSNSLKDSLLFWKRNRHENRVVLDGVNLDIKKGESIGLIGHNGCGKSTLLKLMTKILYPDSGEIEINGRVSSLLELGAGFHPDLSGRENIYNNASIFGLSKKEIDERLNDIIDFSELGDFIDNPVRTYSSGMYMRLAFSVAINVNADILLIDEILAVGDANFQAKCFSKLQEIRRLGTTIVIVSHSLSQIEQFCDRSVWLHGGKIKAQGNPYDIHMEYLDFMVELRKKNAILSGMTAVQREEVGDSDKLRWGSGEVRISDVSVEDLEGHKVSLIRTNSPVRFKVSYKVKKPIKDAVLGIGIFRADGLNVFGTNTRIDKFSKFDIEEDGSYEMTFDSFNLLPGKYIIGFSIEVGEGEPVDYWKTACELDTAYEVNEAGAVQLKHEWAFSDKGITR
ncbi:MAG: ABC transporter ATP-binding protein [Clostridiales bacterium]|nr:ABC transporter ATP-binding protein [Clostridiales bacterium]HAW15550.1 sugar ABC transporter ATP-binding protein [Clostridiales bacterium]